MKLKFVSLMAEPLTSGYRELCHVLTQEGFPLEFIEADWRDAHRMLAEGEAQVGAVCGLLYTLMKAQGINLKPAVAPVLNHPRYDRPVYWADVVVKKEHEAETLSDLRGRHWLFNEQGSYSGYRALMAELVKRDFGLGFLGSATATGAHRESLRELLSGEGDFTVLDSTFLDFQPLEVREQLKVVHSVGPAPAPLLVGVGGAARELEEACLTLCDLPAVFKRMDPVTDRDYQFIRKDWNLSAQGLEQRFLTEGCEHPTFAGVERQAQDRKILARIGQEMLSLRDLPAPAEHPGGIKVHRFSVRGLERYHYLIEPESLSHSNLSTVGFLGEMKPDGDLQALFEADKLILSNLSAYEGFLSYSPTEYAPGKWANLAVFRNTGCRDRWACDSAHMKAIRELSQSSYQHIRLNLGVWPDINSPQDWIATRYLDFSGPTMWRAVRTCP